MPDTKTVSIPVSVLATAESIDELEDWLLANNPEFVEEMRHIREEYHLKGKGKPLAEVLKRWPVK